MSVDCLNPVEVTTKLPWYLAPFHEYTSGFMGSHMIWNTTTGAIMVGLGTFQMVFCLTQLLRCSGQSSKDGEASSKNGEAPNVLDRWGPIATLFWQFWLGLLFVSSPIWGMSGISMGAVFFHALAEFSLMAMRVNVLIQRRPYMTCAATLGHIMSYASVVTFFGMLTVAEVLLDQPIYKALVAGIAAAPSDIGNLILVLILVCGIKPTWNRSARDVMYVCDSILAISHILVFYPHLFLVCSHLPEFTAYLLIVSVAMNLLLLVIIYTKTVKSRQD